MESWEGREQLEKPWFLRVVFLLSNILVYRDCLSNVPVWMAPSVFLTFGYVS